MSFLLEDYDHSVKCFPRLPGPRYNEVELGFCKGQASWGFSSPLGTQD